MDTNVLISAIAFGGLPREILNLIIDRKIDGYISKFIINEVCGVLKNKLEFSERKIVLVERLLLKSFSLVTPDRTVKVIENCPPDNWILDCALSAEVEFLISGDKKHLLPLKEYQGIKIVSPRQFLNYLEPN